LQMAQDPALLTDLPVETVRQMQGQAQRMALPATIFAIKRLTEAIPQLKGGCQPQLPLELALIEATQGGAVAVAAPAAVQAAPTPAPAPAVSAQPAAKPQESKPESKPAKREEPAAPPLDRAAVDKLRTQWKRLSAVVRDRCGYQVQAALNTVRDVAVGGQSVALAFGNNAFSMEMVSKPETQSQVAAILSEFLGRPVQVECQMGDQARLSGRAAPVVQQPTEDGEDPLVAYAVSALGAQVVDEAAS